MLNENHENHCIHCSVKDCKYHCGADNYCSLDSIRIASHEKNPTDERGVDCRSFECKNNQSMF